jgi:succinate-acetate transporter protein
VSYFVLCSQRAVVHADDAPVFHSIGALRKSVGLSALFLCLTITFMLLAIGTYQPSLSLMGLIPLTEQQQRAGFLMKKVNVQKAGGYVGILTALIAYYCGLSEMLTANDIIQIPTGKFIARRTD